MLFRRIGISLIAVFLMVNVQAQIVDSRLSDTTGFAAELALIEQNIGPLADSIKDGLAPLVVQYYGFAENGKADLTQLREGVLMVHESVREDLKQIFLELQQIGFPIEKIVPTNKYGLNRDTTGWNDSHSMEDNNTSAFNYRYITNSDRLSPHGMGIAIDFNPHFNPFESYHHDGKFVEPHDAYYHKNRPGTISDSIVVGLFDKRGWIWGGRWNNPVDYQHFDKRSRSRKHFIMKEPALKDYFQYGDGDGSIALFAEPYFKKRKQPEIFLYKEEKDTFLQYADYLTSTELYQLFKEKGTQKWEDFKSKEVELLEKYTIEESRVEFLEKGSLQGRKISLLIQSYPEDSDYAVLEEWNLELKQELEAYLIGNGAYSVSIEELADLTLVIDFGNVEMFSSYANEANFQTIYVPAAWRLKDLQTPEDRIRFLQALLSDQLPESVQLAKHLQTEIEKACGLKPVSRQLLGPNILETESIKTEIDGIYCRYFEAWKTVRNPMAVISPYSIHHPKVKNWIKKGKIPKKEFEKLVEACKKGLLEYFEEKH